MAQLFSFLSLFFWILFGHSIEATEKDNPHIDRDIYVSVEPYRDIVQYLIGDQGRVFSIVSSSMSSHTFEPTPKITHAMKKASLWVGIGEPFEGKLYTVLTKTLGSDISYLNLKEKLFEELTSTHTSHAHTHHSHHGHAHHSHTDDPGSNGIDPHIWMSPALMQKQIIFITESIREKKIVADMEEIEQRSEELIKKCQILCEKAKTTFSLHAGKSILAAHPVYAHLLNPFDIGQYAIEEDGKEPSALYLTKIIKKISDEHIRTIFTQVQYPSKGAKTISETFSKGETKIDVVQLDPYSHLYFDRMAKSIEAIGSALCQQQSPSLKM